MVQIPDIYLFSISTISGLILFGLWAYVKNILGRNEPFLFIVGIVFLVWGGMAVKEVEEGSFGFLARCFSCVTTALILYSLTYLERGIPFIRRYALYLTGVVVAIEFVALIAADKFEEVWLLVEASASLLAVVLLCISIIATFAKRRMGVLIFVPLLTMLFLGITQLYLLGEEQSADGHWVFAQLHAELGGIEFMQPARMLSRPLLLVCLLLLTMSWVSTQLKASNAGIPSVPEMVTPVVPSENSIHFSEILDKGIALVLKLPKHGIDREVVLPMMTARVLYILAHDRQAGRKTKTSEVSNFSQELTRLLEALEKRGIRLDRKDLIMDDGRPGFVAFRFDPREIVIAPEVHSAYARHLGKGPN